MGVEDYLLASSLLGVLAQRLVRRICPSCSRPVDGVVPPEVARLAAGNGNGANGASLTDVTLYEGQGCDACSHTGFRGRRGIYELLPIDDPVRNLILKHSSTDIIREEEGHVDFGTNASAEFAAKGGESKERIQRAVDYWYVKGLDMFGNSKSYRSERYMFWGLKRRPNAVARQQYKDEIDALILKMGLTIPDPSKGRLYT